MSLVKIQGNASGTGEFTIAAPNSNTNRTLTLPDATGTLNTSGAANEVPAGSASTPSIYPTGDTNTGIYFPASDKVSITTGGTERLQVDNSGNVILNGSQLGASLLSVNGSVYAQQLYGPMYYSNENNTDNVGRSSFTFYRGGVTVGEIVTTNSTCAYNSVSDYRLKENIAPMTGALSKVAQLNPCTYTWKADGSVGQGFIAHELQAVVSDCVTGEKDAVDADGNPQYQGIDTSFLVATLTAAIQELKSELDATKAKVAALEAK
jgi:hypothetical protein